MDRHTARERMFRKFWTHPLAKSNQTTPLFANIGPSWQLFVKKKVQPTGLAFHYSVRLVSAWIELFIDRGRGEREWNKETFDKLLEHRADIEGRFGSKLIWQRLDAKRACRIYHEIPSRALADCSEWPALHDEMVEQMIRFHAAISPWRDQLEV